MTAATSSSRPSVTDPTRRRIGRAIAGGSTLIAAVAVVSIAAMGRWAFLLDNGVLLFAVTAIGLGILAWVMLAPQPSNTAVWVFVLAAGFSALAVTGQAFQAYAARDLPEVIDIVRWAPADLSTWLAVAIGPAWWAWAPGLFLPVTLGVLLFPDGRLPGPRWRWLALASVVSIGLIVGAFLWEMRPTSTVLYDFGEAEDDDTLVSQLFGIGFVGGVVCGVASVVALVARHRRSAPEVKRQLRMVVVGYLGFLVGGLGSVLVDIVSGGGLNNADTPVLDRLLLLSGQLALLAGFAVAILKYRLYDLDLVISKAFTALALAGFITAGYVGLVVGIGRLLGGDADTAVSLAAIAVVAVAFHPVRRIVQRAANRLVYGDRASPYEVLARFGRRAAESDEALIGRVPELVVGGTGATSATLWRRTGGVLEVVATWPRTDDSDRTVAHASAETPDPDADRSWPIEHDGELLGGLTLVEARGERLSSSDERVVTSLVLALGLAMRNARLTDQLRASIVELEASRARVLAAADEARRSLEADLERGPLQRLAAVEAGLQEARLRDTFIGDEQLTTMLAELADNAEDATAVLHRFALGLYPPRLEAEGVAAAIAEHRTDGRPAVSVDTAEIGRHEREVEAAVYFTVLEALQNATKHAAATSIVVTVAERDGRLTFEVADDGCGFDHETAAATGGLRRLGDRLDTVGGDVAVESVPGGGTTVRGSVPIDPDGLCAVTEPAGSGVAKCLGSPVAGSMMGSTEY